MTGIVTYTDQVNGWYVTVDIDVAHVTASWHEANQTNTTPTYTATVTVHPVHPDSDAPPANIGVTTMRQADISTVHSPSESQDSESQQPATGKTYVITNTNASTRSTIRVGVTHRNISETATISLPRAHPLLVLHEVNEDSEMTAGELIDCITETYPQETRHTAVNRFDRSCEELLDPETYLPLTNTLIEGCRAVKNYRDDPGRYIAKHAFELLPCVYPDADPERYTDLIDLYNAQPELPDTTEEDVLRAAISRSILDMDDPISNLARINVATPGDRWDEGLSTTNLWLLCTLLYGTGYEPLARGIARKTPAELAPDEYLKKKEYAASGPDTNQVESWGVLLPTAAKNENGDFHFIIGNLAYWIAGRVNAEHNESRTASVLYEIAADVHADHGGQSFAASAESRKHYTRGLHDRFESRYDEAYESFRAVVENWDSWPKRFIDVYSVYGAAERLIEHALNSVRHRDGDIDEALTSLEELTSMLPDRGILPSRASERHVKLHTYLDGAAAELAGRKLREMQTTTDGDIPTDAQIREPLHTAKLYYSDINQDHDIRMVEGLLSDYEDASPSLDADQPMSGQTSSD